MGIISSEGKGILYCLLHAVALTAQSNIAKVFTYSSHTSYINFVRYLFLIFTVPLIEFDKASSCNTTDLILYITLGVLGIVPSCTAVFSFTLMGVGDSIAIEFGGNIILVGVIGHLILDEKITIAYFFLLLVDCLGIILVVKPSFIFGTSEEGIKSKEIGAIVAISGSFAVSLFQVYIRKLEHRNNLHCFLFMAVQSLVGMALTGAWTTLESAWEIPNTWLNICIVGGYGIVNILQYIFEVKALANAEVKNVALALTLSVVLSYVLQITIFGEEVDWVSIGGAVVIILCVVLSVIWDYVLEKVDKVTTIRKM
ncbi:Solute carrier family 35 member G1 [Holothuria leucospilota]|uniref:Solute carrier family 35 member G1 n=1 Tax=Holothuria leucospilota TaxID=206669 RepID=A0A9Q1HIB8_HOLLE|nr:Solute carrier family 35 member G1 [Holothuria leucospilota]